jgi:colanic acid biosynthesis glycosyl transferase WcaI
VYSPEMEEIVKIIFLNRFFHPDHSATSQMLSDLAFSLARKGRAVCVVTSRQRYDAPTAVLPLRDTVKGVSVYRIWTSRFGRHHPLGRTTDYATFYLSAIWCLWQLVRSGDVVIAKTDPPMLSVIVVPLCRLRKAKLVNWLQDIFPEVAEALGVGGRAARSVYSLLRWLRNGSLKAADMNVVLGERMEERVSGLGISHHQIRMIPNWANRNNIMPVDGAANALRQAWRLGNAFVVGYSGNLGRAHEINTLLEAMAFLEKAKALGGPTSTSVVWLFIGSGAMFSALREEVASLGLKSVCFKPYQPSELLAQSLSAADVHLVSLRPELEGLIVPSKFYGICAAGRPTIFVGDNDGEIARLISRHRCGRNVSMGDGTGLAKAILELAADPTLLRQMGERAQHAFDAEFAKPIAIARWENLLLEVSGVVMPDTHNDAGSSLASRNAR